ncbi:MAG: type VI secretion system protein TssA, partial [Caldimonas sp.]
SFSAELDAIQDLRRADDPTLDQGEWVTALKVADWPAVQSACEKVLAQRSKDLRVAAWFTEACAKVDGYAGMAVGLDLCAALCERYWDELYPRIDTDGDTEERSDNLRWLLSQVQELASQIPVLRTDARGFSLRDMAAAQANGRAGAVPADDTSSVVSLLMPEDIAGARRATSSAFFTTNLAAAQRALRALERLQTLADVKLGDDGPGFSAARRALEDAVHGIRQLAPDAEIAAQTLDNTTGPADGAALPTGALRTRADALRQLRAVADFFRRTEPHSPVAYLAERGAQWGEMPLHEWLRSVVKDQGVLAQIEELLGVAPTPPTAE